MKTNQICQSCSMPLNKDPQQGGTNYDGTRSQKYCSYCYAEGKFVQPEMTVQEMQRFVKEKLRDMKMPGFLANFYVKKIPKLERWNTQ